MSHRDHKLSAFGRNIRFAILVGGWSGECVWWGMYTKNCSAPVYADLTLYRVLSVRPDFFYELNFENARK